MKQQLDLTGFYSGQIIFIDKKMGFVGNALLMKMKKPRFEL
ncbi:hypothetical protein [Epilithonimonas sp.]